MNRVARWLWEERQFQIRLAIFCLFFETDEVGLLADYNEGDFAEKTLTSLDNPMSHERIGRSARETAWATTVQRLCKVWKNSIIERWGALIVLRRPKLLHIQGC